MIANVWHFPHMCGKSHRPAYFPLSYQWSLHIVARSSKVCFCICINILFCILYFVFVSIFCWGIWLLFARASWGPAAGRGQAPVEREPPTRTEPPQGTMRLLSPPCARCFFENPRGWFERKKKLYASQKMYTWVSSEHPADKRWFFLQTLLKDYLLSVTLFAVNHCN